MKIYLVAVLLTLNSILAWAEVKIEVHHRTPADIFELLDSASQWYPGFNYDEYTEYWKKHVPELPGDAALFREYSLLRKKYFSEEGEKDPLKNSHGFFSSPETNSADPISLAFYTSDNLSDAFKRTSRVLNKSEQGTLEKFFKHFEARALSLIGNPNDFELITRNISRDVSPKGLGKYLKALTTFYGAGADLSFDVVVVWWPPVNPTWDSAAGDVLVLRRNPAKHSETYAADIVMHELTHALSSMRETKTKAALTAKYLEICPAHSRMKKLEIFEEPLSVAAGQMAFTEIFYPERFAHDESWYVVPWFNLFGRLIYPITKEYLSAGKTLDEPFIKIAGKLCLEALKVADKLGSKSPKK